MSNTTYHLTGSNYLNLVMDLLDTDGEYSPGRPAQAQHLLSFLVVDDDPEMREYIHSCLNTAFPMCQVFEAGNGVQALTFLEQIKPSLVLTDIMMPEMDGITLTQQIRSRNSLNKVPVLLITGEASGSDVKAKLGELPLPAMLLKPFDSEKLVYTVHRVITQHSSTDLP